MDESSAVFLLSLIICSIAWTAQFVNDILSQYNDVLITIVINLFSSNMHTPYITLPQDHYAAESTRLFYN